MKIRESYAHQGGRGLIPARVGVLRLLGCFFVIAAHSPPYNNHNAGNNARATT